MYNIFAALSASYISLTSERSLRSINNNNNHSRVLCLRTALHKCCVLSVIHLISCALASGLRWKSTISIKTPGHHTVLPPVRLHIYDVPCRKSRGMFTPAICVHSGSGLFFIKHTHRDSRLADARHVCQ